MGIIRDCILRDSSIYPSSLREDLRVHLLTCVTHITYVFSPGEYSEHDHRNLGVVSSVIAPGRSIADCLVTPQRSLYPCTATRGFSLAQCGDLQLCLRSLSKFASEDFYPIRVYGLYQYIGSITLIDTPYRIVSGGGIPTQEKKTRSTRANTSLLCYISKGSSLPTPLVISAVGALGPEYSDF